MDDSSQGMAAATKTKEEQRAAKSFGLGSSAKRRGRVHEATSETGAEPGRARQASAVAAGAASPQTTGYGGGANSETANEVPLETVTAENEHTIDLQANMYVSRIMPDPATIVYAERGSVQAASGNDNASGSCEEPPTPPPQRHRGGSTPRPTPVRGRRRMALDGDERVVREAQSGRWSTLLPVGTVVRRPSVKLVQLVAQAIHESPHRVLRVWHVYAALQNRYPYFRLQDKKGIRNWEGSVRHALLQKWFLKLRPTRTPGVYETDRPNFFWGLNYTNRPRNWQMPLGLPQPLLPTNDQGEQQQQQQQQQVMQQPLQEPPQEQQQQQQQQSSVNRSCKVTLKVANKSACNMMFTVWDDKPLRRLMRAYCRYKGVNMQNVKFRFDGQLIEETDTPARLDMQDEDTIDVFHQ